MQIDGRVKPLGRVDHAALRDKVLALDEKAWLEDDLSDWQPMRGDTRTVVLLFCDGWEPIVIDKKAVGHGSMNRSCPWRPPSLIRISHRAGEYCVPW